MVEVEGPLSGWFHLWVKPTMGDLQLKVQQLLDLSSLLSQKGPPCIYYYKFQIKQKM